MSSVAFVLAATLAASAIEAMPEPAVFDAPNETRWRLEKDDHCREETHDGGQYCLFEPRSLWRRFMDPRGLGAEYHTRIVVFLTPLFCSSEESLPFAALEIEGRARDFYPKEPIALEQRDERRLVGRSKSFRGGYVSTSHDAVFVQLNAPRGVTEQDERDFEAVLASVRDARRPDEAYRRGLWLHRNLPDEGRRERVPTCGMEPPARAALSTRELWRATREQPLDWRPWALLGEQVERTVGGEDPIEILLRDKDPSSEQDIVFDVWAELWVKPFDPEAAHEAARRYQEALRRGPPSPRAKKFSTGPLDRSTILAHEAGLHLRLGDVRTARARYEEALADENASNAYGFIEAAVWLAEDAHARGDLEKARRLYRIAERAWWSFHDGWDMFGVGHGRAMLRRIETRLSELD